MESVVFVEFFRCEKALFPNVPVFFLCFLRHMIFITSLPSLSVSVSLSPLRGLPLSLLWSFILCLVLLSSFFLCFVLSLLLLLLLLRCCCCWWVLRVLERLFLVLGRFFVMSAHFPCHSSRCWVVVRCTLRGALRARDLVITMMDDRIAHTVFDFFF